MAVSAGLFAQAPGGINAQLKMWMRSDLAPTITATTGRISDWKYVNDPTRSFKASGNDRPVLFTDGINFQTTVRFNGSYIMNGPVGASAPITAGNDAYSLFAVWNSTYTGANGERIWTQWNCVTQTTGFSLATAYNGTNFLYGAQFEIDPYGQGIQQVFKPGDWQISQLNMLDQGSNDLEIVNQQNITTAPLTLSSDGTTGNSTRYLVSDKNVIGARCTRNAEGFHGDLAELIVYDRPVSGIERQKIFSYLALKYGISLPGFNYAAPDWNGTSGTIYWRTNSVYNHDIFGIGKEDATTGAALDLLRSNSLNTGSGNGTGQAAKGNIILTGKPATLDEGEYLMVANDGKSLNETTTELPAIFTGARRLQREWLVQQTGNTGTIDLSFDTKGLTLSGDLSRPTDFALLIDEDGDGDFTTGTVSYILASSIINGQLQFPLVTFHNGVVFTIASGISLTLLTQPEPAGNPTPVTTTAKAPYPNPFTNEIRLMLDLKGKQNVSVKLYNPAGAVARLWSMPGTHGRNYLTLQDLGNLTAGIYVISYSYNGGTSRQLMIKK